MIFFEKRLSFLNYFLSVASVCSSAATVLTVWASKTRAYSTISSVFESDDIIKRGRRLMERRRREVAIHDLEGSSAWLHFSEPAFGNESPVVSVTDGDAKHGGPLCG